MKIKDIVSELEKFAPLAYQESYDNSGLIVGDGNNETTGALICFDVSTKIVDEAISKGVNLIISHHPIIFKGIKKLNGKNIVEEVVIKAIKNDIAIYASHTNMDSAMGGVNWTLANKLNLNNIKVLKPIEEQLYKLVCYIPNQHVEIVQKAIFEAGAGNIGDYECCSFKHSGTGSFKAKEGAKPYVGELNKFHLEAEERLEAIVEKRNLSKVVNALILSHPYEEPAYDIYKQEIPLKNIGLGAIGDLNEEIILSDFFKHLKEILNVSVIKFNGDLNKNIKRIAVCGGSGSSLIGDAISNKADVLVTGDCTYHQFLDNTNRLIIADIGHYESEFFVKHVIYDILSKKIPKFAVYLSEQDSNPVKYF